MYKSEGHKTITEKWISDIKVKNYAESTIARKISIAPIMVRESLKGVTQVEKARNLLLSFRANNVAIENNDGLIWDKRLVVPIGTMFETRTDYQPFHESNVYTIVSIVNDYTVTLLKKSNTTTSNYSIKTFNEQLLKCMWILHNPTPDHYKKIGIPPKKIIDCVAITNQIGCYSLFYNSSLNGKVSVGLLNTSPTGNCQLCLLGVAVNLLRHITSKENLKKAFLEINKISGKRLVLIDIKSNLIPKLIADLGTKAVTLNGAYTSSNGSQMSIVIINTLNL